MIKSNPKLKSYCDVHKLDYETTDCVELFDIVYSDDDYEIIDGKMVVENDACDSNKTYYPVNPPRKHYPFMPNAKDFERINYNSIYGLDGFKRIMD